VRRLTKEKLVWGFDKESPQAITISTGDVLVVETHDRFGGIDLTDFQESLHARKSQLDAITGPIYVEGSDPGSTLKVEILDLQLTGDRGVILVVPNLGGFGKRIEKAVAKQVVLDSRKGCAYFDDRFTIPLRPMVGRIGTAPAGESARGLTVGPHGGNMDNNDITKGSAVFLPVFVPGALLSMGDVHAAMGDGESALSGIECQADITIRCSVLRDFPITHPFVLTADGEAMATADGETLEEACEVALHNMALMMQRKLGLSYVEAAMLISVAGSLRICQIVNPRVGVKLSLPRSILAI
jgi:amidase